PARAAYAGWRGTAFEANGRTALVRNFAGGRAGDDALRAPWSQRERRFLFRRRLPPARYQTGSVCADLRNRPRTGLGRAGFGADREQHLDPSAHALLRTGATQLSADQRALAWCDISLAEKLRRIARCWSRPFCLKLCKRTVSWNNKSLPRQNSAVQGGITCTLCANLLC